MDNKKIKEIITNSYRERKLEFIKIAVCKHFREHESVIFGKSIKSKYSKPRQAFIYIAKNNGFTNKEIKSVVKRDVSTINYAFETIKGNASWDTDLRNELEHLMTLVENKSEILKNEIDISDEYYYIDLSSNTSFKLGKEKAIVLSGFTNEEIKAFSKANNLGHISPVNCNNSNLHLIIKK